MKPVKVVFADNNEVGFAVFKGGKWHWFSNPHGPDGGRKLYSTDAELMEGIKAHTGASEARLEDGMRA